MSQIYKKFQLRDHIRIPISYDFQLKYFSNKLRSLRSGEHLKAGIASGAPPVAAAGVDHAKASTAEVTAADVRWTAATRGPGQAASSRDHSADAHAGLVVDSWRLALTVDVVAGHWTVVSLSNHNTLSGHHLLWFLWSSLAGQVGLVLERVAMRLMRGVRWWVVDPWDS